MSIKSLLTGALLAGLFSFLLLAPPGSSKQPSTFLLPFEVTTADEESCAVYRAWLGDWPEKDLLFLAPATTPYSEFVPSIANLYGFVAPTRFERDTGVFEPVGYFPGEEPSQRAVREVFDLDTTAFFPAVRTPPMLAIEHCFKGTGSPTGFHAGSFKTLYRDVREPGLDHDGAVTPVQLVFLSPVGFSDDGRYGLLWMEQYCGWLCGLGMFFLLEKIDGEWQVIGDSWRWIS